MQPGNIKKILLIGSGPIVIGQACEFDYSGTQACKALKAEGYKVILLNDDYTPMEFVVRLKPGLRFSDGSALEADDVVATFEGIGIVLELSVESWHLACEVVDGSASPLAGGDSDAVDESGSDAAVASSDRFSGTFSAETLGSSKLCSDACGFDSRLASGSVTSSAAASASDTVSGAEAASV